MDKKTILVSGIMGGILLYIVPGIFLPKSATALMIIFKILGGIAMAGGVIFFIAGDMLLGKKSGISNNLDKNIRRQIKEGKITPEEAFKLQQDALKNELELAKTQLELEKQKALIEKERATAKKHKAGPSVSQSGLSGGSKLPDVLGNLGPLFGSSSSKPNNSKKDDDLRNLF